MPITTTDAEYKRLRSFLNPFIKGASVDAILTALAAGGSSHLINNVAAVNDQLYIATASGQYLDQRLSEYGITRPPSVGLSDDVFRTIGIEVKNRKQVRDLINNLLSAMFGDEAVRASNQSRAFEPFNLSLEQDSAEFIGRVAGMISDVTIEANIAGPSGNSISIFFNGVSTINATVSSYNIGNPSNMITFVSGDGNQIPNSSTTMQLSGGSNSNILDCSLVVNFDESHTATIQFDPSEFQNIAAAKAQEIADAITKTLRNQGLSGTAIASNNGNGAFVEILSDTIGPSSSVTILGGSSQNTLKFDSPVAAGGNLSTKWTITSQSGGIMRFMWTGGADPQLGKVQAGNYVNIFGGGFSSSSNVGSYTITNAVGGTVGSSYFELENSLGSSGVVTQGSDTAVLFYNPVRKTVASQLSYAAVYQAKGKVLQIFMPAATKVIRRDRIGSTHLHDAPRGTFTLNANPNGGDVFSITTLNGLTAGADFAIGASVQITCSNIAAAINTLSGLDATSGTNSVSVFNNSLSNTLTISYTGSASIVASGPLGDMVSLQPNQPGSYVYDTTQPFTVSSTGTLLNQNLDGTMSRVISVKDSSAFPDSQGYLIFGYGTNEQEGPVPYTGRPSSTTLLISPAYTVKNAQLLGTDVALVASKAPVSLSRDGTDYPIYITDIVSGRTYAQDLINSVAATGISIVFTILYPNDIGLGKWSTPYTENPSVWS
jgi:hypothetical protein